MTRLVLTFLLLVSGSDALAQKITAEENQLKTQKKNAGYQLHIKKASSPIKIDGIMDEPAWQEAETATDFWMVLPMDTSHARVRTDVKMTYDDGHLHLMAICYHAVPGPYYVESLRRDFVFGKNDNFLVFIDPFEDQTTGFSFGANAAGAQWDGTMYQGGSVDLSWDNKWISKVKNYKDKWILELAIPFKSIRYKQGVSQWGINFSRLDLKTTEKSSWAPVPRQFPTASLAYTGSLIWDQPPPKPGLNISVIPYTLGKLTKDFEKHTDNKLDGEIGGDAKIALSSSLNLDLTINPDFSQVEVDQQVTNLDRFELFFPERRQFFLENGDLFANFGYTSIRPFFSRRIGLDVPIQFGARLSGKLNRDWRIGAMDMQTSKVSETALPVQNFAVLALQRQLFKRSNIGFIFVNKQSVNYDYPADSTKPTYSKYNRNIGLEYNLASSNNIWNGKFLLLKSFSPGLSGKDFVHAANLVYASRKWNLAWQHEYVGTNYNAEVGYVPRKDYFKINPQAQLNIFPHSRAILSHSFRIGSFYYFRAGDFHHTDDETYLLYLATFRNQMTASTFISHDFVELQQPFDPTNSGKDSLPAGSRHSWKAWGTEIISKPQSTFTWGFSSRLGGYYADGSRLNLTGSLGYRFQPYVSLALNASYNNINLPQPWGKTIFWLVGPRLDITMTNTLFFTAFLQYNQQQNNINLNTRFQWRYRPASDLFIVYTDNYFSDPLMVKNRAIVLKLTYWWNL